MSPARVILLILGILGLISTAVVLTLVRFSSTLSREWEREDDEQAILDCPHCAGRAEYRTFRNYDGHFAYESAAVVCSRCGAQTKEEVTSGYYGIAVSPETIIQKWNRRCGR